MFLPLLALLVLVQGQDKYWTDAPPNHKDPSYVAWKLEDAQDLHGRPVAHQVTVIPEADVVTISTTTTLAQTSASTAFQSPWVINSSISVHVIGTSSVLSNISPVDRPSLLPLRTDLLLMLLVPDLQTGQKNGGGSDHNGLDYFDADIPTSVALRSSIDPFQLHCQLGHPFLQNLKKMVPAYQYIQSLPCEVY
ncbi:hypothetical protein Acr_00g0099480 [Actinidia rufa]|uniref:GAG-pre-integrase domain-containing protein n=1 Tax=Actinidia rufa TaxID=165716 RepID=A0A7J0DZJ5_9ERIC|nr:hypothetical protein Acr_00g0099480 [Actinidia rufa]